VKQKYVILKNDEKNELVIREYAELDKEMLSFLCEQTHDSAAIELAIAKGKEALIATLRTGNMYPIGILVEKMAESVIKLYDSENDQPVELLFNDIDMLAKDRDVLLVVDDVEAGSDEIDKILDEDDTVPDYDDKDVIKNITLPFKVADDESVDLDDES